MHVDRSVAECRFGHLCAMSLASVGLTLGLLFVLL